MKQMFFSRRKPGWARFIRKCIVEMGGGGKFLLSFLCAMFYLPFLSAQVQCGSFIAPPPPPNTPPDSLVYDRFGNAYHVNSLQMPIGNGVEFSGSENNCDTYFHLVFPVAMPMTARNTVSQVFCDLSTLIIRPSEAVCGNLLPKEPVNIMVSWVALNNSIGGSGSP